MMGIQDVIVKLSNSLNINKEILLNHCEEAQEAIKKLEFISSKLIHPNLDLIKIECQELQRMFDDTSNKFLRGIEEMKGFNRQLDLMFKVIQPNLTWLQTDGEPAHMKYTQGKSPWSFYLQHIPCRIDQIQNTLESLQSSLIPAVCPQVGDVVCVKEQKVYFRAIILKLMLKDRTTVLNIDNGLRKIVAIGQLYDLPMDSFDIPVQNVHCSLLPEDPEMENLWTEELQLHFVGVISECNLSVTLIEELSDLSDKPPKFLIQAIGQNDRSIPKAHFNVWLSSRLIPEIKAKMKLYEMLPLDILDELNPYSEKRNSQEFFDPSPNAFVEQLMVDKISDSADKTELVINVQPEVHYKINEVSSTIEAEPEDKNVISDLPDNSYCFLFLRNKTCWKPNCNKLHTSPSGLLNDDQLSMHVELFNKITLPSVKQELPVEVLTVISGCSFYVALHPNFSDIGEDHHKLETITNLEADMNNPVIIKDYKCPQIDPSLADLVIARDHSGNFRRGRIVEISETTAGVFFIDYGYEEDIAIMDLRVILPQFMHLPAQAVFTTLSQIGPKSEMADQAKEFLTTLIEHKSLIAKVVYRDLKDSCLSVELFAKDRVCINELMVEKGFCFKIT